MFPVNIKTNFLLIFHTNRSINLFISSTLYQLYIYYDLDYCYLFFTTTDINNNMNNGFIECIFFKILFYYFSSSNKMVTQTAAILKNENALLNSDSVNHSMYIHIYYPSTCTFHQHRLNDCLLSGAF